MIGKLLPHQKTFGPRSRYVQFNKQTAERCDASTLTRNLDGAHPEVAHSVMAATARQSRRVQKPCGHLVVSWSEDDAPTPDTMVEILDQTLSDLGLAEHQAIYVAHNDTEHAHVHVIYNRIHPETHRAARDSFQRRGLRQSLVRQEVEYGLTQTPLISKGEHQRPTLSDRAMAKREDQTPSTRMSKKRCAKLKDELAYCFNAANGWSSFHGMLMRRGYDLVKAGPGVRLTRHHTYAKLSDLAPKGLTSKTLKQKWGDFADYWESLKRPRRQLDRLKTNPEVDRFGLDQDETEKQRRTRRQKQL